MAPDNIFVVMLNLFSRFRIIPLNSVSHTPVTWRLKHGLAGRIHRGVPRPAPGITSVTVKATAAASDNNTVISSQDSLQSFDLLGLNRDLQIALTEKQIVRPTEIQAASVPAIIRDRRSDFLLASHTGSGKTLAYLLPLVHLLKQTESAGVITKPRRPRALVLGPTRELTDQILAVAKSLSHRAKFRSVCVNGGGDWGKQREQLTRAVDILIGTPTRVVQHAEKSSLYYGDVDVVVIDEADTMFDRGFGPEVKAILTAVRNKPHPARCIMVSATMTKAVRRLIEEECPRMRTIETQTLHRGVVGARHTFLPLPGSGDRLDTLFQVISGEQERGKRIMVFCNTIASCRAAEHHLRERGLPTVCYHGDVPMEDRRGAIAIFSQDDNGCGGRPVMVATDLAARGLDVPGRVDHVINFDFPLNPIDYLHRTGRTARAGATGRITSLIGKGDRVLAQRVEDALARGLPLDQLSANKNVLPPHMRPKPETLLRRAQERKAAKQSGRGIRGSKRNAASDGSPVKKAGRRTGDGKPKSPVKQQMRGSLGGKQKKRSFAKFK